MSPEDCKEINEGKWPAEWYSVANTEKELVALIKNLRWGRPISADVPAGSGFMFGEVASGGVFFSTDDFLDDDEMIENPDSHENRYKTVEDGVRDFKINGKPLIDVVRGARFFQSDIPFVIFDA